VTSSYLSSEDAQTWTPDLPCGGRAAAIERTRRRMKGTGQWHDSQVLGRHGPIGCVALEITQRCNLDCTLCYLSESSEAVKDLPIEAVFRRIDLIAETYGRGTNVQITGGEPTLRNRRELIAICHRLVERGLKPALFTNGIHADRALLAELAAAGLIDVAFHVDMTQQRQRYQNEAALNALRKEYIERARGLRIAVVFNTTVFAGNLDEVPMLARFFAEHADVVGLASFQPHASVGRGVEDGPSDIVSADAVVVAIEAGLGCRLPVGTIQTGHARCNRYGIVLVAGGRAVPIVEEPRFAAAMITASSVFDPDRRDRVRALREIVVWASRRPRLWPSIAAWGIGRLWALRCGLWSGRLRVRKLSFFVHDFMDACRLERDRLKACAFTVATESGLVPMCLHNARRDAFILAPVRLASAKGETYWEPATGRAGRESVAGAVILSRKTAKGRARLAFARTERKSPRCPLK
jgi:molybdenum cofactor biosynthesis enzyme MoaA